MCGGGKDDELPISDFFLTFEQTPQLCLTLSGAQVLLPLQEEDYPTLG